MGESMHRNLMCSPARGVGEANAASARTLPEQALLFLEVVNQIQLMSVDLTGELLD